MERKKHKLELASLERLVPRERVVRRIGEWAEDRGVQAYAVGGYVRDLLLGHPSKDIDFVVVGDGIQFAREVARLLGVRSVVVYPKFGTASIPYRGYKLEFVTARSERYRENSRKPEVAAAGLEDDLARRDFTINALALGIRPSELGRLIDPFSGRQDLERGIIRTPLDPVVTFHDDPLRILRAIRFATQLEFTIEPRTLEAIRSERERLRIVSQERITEELLKILSARKPSLGFRLLEETGLLEIVLPEVAEMRGVEQIGPYHHKDVFEHTLKVLDRIATVSDSLPLRYAALLHDVAKPRTKAFKEGVGWTFHGHDEIGARMIATISRRLRLPNEMSRYAEKLTRLHLRPIALVEEGVTDSAIRRLLVQAGEDLEDLLTLCRADITSRNPKRVREHLANFERLVQRMREVEEKDRMRAFQSPVRGDVIMQVCNIPPGPLVGKLKKMIEEAILDGKIPNEYDAAFAYLLQIKDEVLKEAGIQSPEPKDKGTETRPLPSAPRPE
ncbi:MAG: CCA tRNA nucleotidyltransferase [candidate division KSB1 bacterium]|nr:CCA tRNA nucleotidyltransferase [candidate division KSB1 bacterium]